MAARRAKRARQALPRSFRWVFWDVVFAQLDAEEDADFILGRILEFGTMREVRWVVKTYGLDRIHRFFRESGDPELSDRTIYFWRAVLGAEKENWRRPPAWRKHNSVPWIE